MIRSARSRPAGRSPQVSAAPRSRAAAFTLLEILLSIALIALLAGVLTVGASRLGNGQPSTPEDIFWQAVREARKTALRSERVVALSFDAEAAAFAVQREDGTRRDFALKPGRKITVDFLQPAQGAGYILLGGELVETQKLATVRFFPDGTCSPFRVQFRGETGAPWSLSIDPWTCAPVLETKTP